jgi:enoyl-CoA hydratase
MATMAVPEKRLEEETNRMAERIALIPTDLISLTKASINHTFELMGFRAGIEYAAKIHDLSHTTPSIQQFHQTLRENGLKAALDERDAKFGDLRTSKESRKGRQRRGKE